MKEKYDVIIVGSGIGGLAAACLLSFKKKVLVLEKNMNFGGYCTSFKRGKFVFESTVHAISGCKKHHFVNKFIKKCQIPKKIKFLESKTLYKTIFPRHNIVVPQEDLKSYISILTKHFPKEEDSLKKFFEKIKNIFLEVEKIDKNKHLIKSPNLVKFANVSLKEILDFYFKDDELKAIISQYWVYCGLPPSKLSSIAFIVVALDYLSKGSYYLRGGTGNLVEGLVDRIKRNDGDIYSQEEVEKILIRGTKVIGVKTKNSRFFYCNYLISNIDVFTTFNIFSKYTIEASEYMKEISKYSPTISAFKVYLGLKINVKKLGIFDYEIFLNSTYDLDESFIASIENNADKATILITIYSNIDSTACGKDNTILSITMLSDYEYWSSLNNSEYRKNKMKIAKILIKRTEKIIPNLNEYIETMVVATPLTMQKYTGNMNGASYGWNRNIYMLKHMNVQTPIKNLFLSSSWTKIGGGIAGAMRAAERTYDILKNTA